jgi:hypothetical protein
MSVHVTPLPVNPALQAHVLLPDVLVQVAFALHPPLFVAHSLMSVHTRAAPVCPFPENPGLQAHVRLPTVFVQFAFAVHPPLFVRHSLMSVQVTPLPV